MKQFTVIRALRRMTRLRFNFLWKGVKSDLAKTFGNRVLHGVEVAIVVVGG